MSPSEFNGSLKMTDAELRELLREVAEGRKSPDEAHAALSERTSPVENLGFARIDHDRETRTGFPEVIYGQGKTPAQVAEIAASIHARSGVVLVTRASEEAHRETLKKLPEAQFDPHSRLIWADSRGEKPHLQGVTVVSAGTADMPVAGEAAMTATLMGCDVKQMTDVGVAGLHRLLDRLEEIRKAKVLVVVAGMEGALPSVVAGLVSAPVIAVPTSVGYGASFEGLAALLAMLNSCASGISVVNIDGGFAAGFQAATIARAIANG